MIPEKTRNGLNRVLNCLAAVLIVVWCAWWVESIGNDRLWRGDHTWIGPLKFIAGDFKVHIDHVARIQAKGIDAYLLKDDPTCADFPYPPMIPRLFAWVVLFSPAQAATIWQGAIALFLTIAALTAWRARRALQSWPVPLAVIVVALLYSTPAVMAMERGQCDPLVIPAILIVAWLARGRGLASELAAGSLLGVTAWLKYYPGLAVFGLLALGRSKAALSFFIVVAVIGLHDRAQVRTVIENGRRLAKMTTDQRFIHSVSHSIVSDWKAIPLVRQKRLLRKVPPMVAAGLLLLPLILVVSRRIATSANTDPLIAPYLIWLTAAATFGMPYAIDYNLVTLPLVALCVWDRRDPVVVHMAMGLFCLWWQPVALKVGGEILLTAKIAALYATGFSLIQRAAELNASQIPAQSLQAAYRGPILFSRRSEKTPMTS